MTKLPELAVIVLGVISMTASLGLGVFFCLGLGSLGRGLAAMFFAEGVVSAFIVNFAVQQYTGELDDMSDQAKNTIRAIMFSISLATSLHLARHCLRIIRRGGGGP